MSGRTSQQAGEAHFDRLGNPTAAHTRDALEAERDGQRQRERYTCALPSCDVQIDLPRYVFCLDHWEQLPADLQRQLWEHFSWPAHYGKEPPSPTFATAKARALALLSESDIDPAEDTGVEPAGHDPATGDTPEAEPGSA